MPPRLIVVIQIGTLLLAGLTFASNTFKFEQNVIDRNWRNKETQFVSKANIQIESGLTSEDEYGQRTEISHSEKTPVPAKCGYQVRFNGSFQHCSASVTVNRCHKISNLLFFFVYAVYEIMPLFKNAHHGHES